MRSSRALYIDSEKICEDEVVNLQLKPHGEAAFATNVRKTNGRQDPNLIHARSAIVNGETGTVEVMMILL